MSDLVCDAMATETVSGLLLEAENRQKLAYGARERQENASGTLNETDMALSTGDVRFRPLGGTMSETASGLPLKRYKTPKMLGRQYMSMEHL
jgi:hypothetical protein